MDVYSNSDLTVPSDKLIAFSGLAQHFQEYLAQDTYVAGMWLTQLPEALLWEVHLRSDGLTSRPLEYIAPSWSWASTKGQVTSQPPFVNTQNLCSVLDVQVHSTVPGNAKGSLKGGFLRLRGNLMEKKNMDSEIMVALPSGYGFIPGSVYGKKDVPREDNCIEVQPDETTHDGKPSLSFLDGLTPDMISNGNMTQAVRKCRPWTESESDLFSFPLQWLQYMGQPQMCGLILKLVEVQTQATYQRVGRFTALGDRTTSWVMFGLKTEVLIL